MKTQMIIGGILFGVAACTAPADGYRITGNIEGAGDGKAISRQVWDLLQKIPRSG